LSFTPCERISNGVVGNVPTRTFEEGKGEFGELHLGDKTGSHTFISELSSFEVGTSGTRRTTVFHVSTLESGTSEVLSESAGKGFSVDDNGSSTTEAGRGNVAGEGLTAASEPLAE